MSPEVTVRESVQLTGRLSQRTDTVGRVLGMVDLTHKASTLVTQLSGGERRRLDFATAVYGGPELVILDEPTTGLDVSSRDHLWDAVDRLREDGSAVVLTTLEPEEAQQRADRIGVMHAGTVHHQGTVSELTRRLPAVIRFSLSGPTQAPPPLAERGHGDSFLVQTFGMERDLTTLLIWAEDHGVRLQDLTAGPTNLDDVLRTIGTEAIAS